MSQITMTSRSDGRLNVHRKQEVPKANVSRRQTGKDYRCVATYSYECKCVTFKLSRPEYEYE
eukprot:scaffold56983_cov17-Prasinocladus_malaysianus.AAC.2